MLKRDYFIAAMHSGQYRFKNWVISIFSPMQESQDNWMDDAKQHQIVSKDNKIFFVDTTRETGPNLVEIEDAEINQPLFYPKDKLTITDADNIENLNIGPGKSIETTYGRLLANYILLIYPFGKKIGYINNKFSAGQIEEIIAKRLRDTADREKDNNNESFIYVDEYLKFADAAMSLTGFTQVTVPASTEKTITPPPGIKEYRAELLEKYKDQLGDPAIIAKIDSLLVQYLKDWLKDDPGMGFLISNKSFDVVRKELYLMIGANVGMDDSAKFNLVENSLSEGWDPNKFDILNTVSRSGSFSRGAETEKGGVETKWIFRASSNSTVVNGNCGSELGVVVFVNDGEDDKLVGFTAIQDSGEQVKITEENVGQYLGKAVRLRSPMYCHFKKTDYCSICLGDRLTSNPTGLSTALTAYGSTFMDMMMSAMHGTALKTKKLDWKKQLQ